MARKNKVSHQGGVLNIWKPAGLSSMQTVSRVKRITNNNKAGHVGTLDPFADGVLPVVLGRSTNVIRYMEDFKKTYRVVIHFGQNTSTQDLSGEIIATADEQNPFASLDEFAGALAKADNELSGKITQTIPKYSAIKTDGKPSYWYARQGIEVEAKKKDVEIFSVNLLAAGINDAVSDNEIFTEDSFQENCAEEVEVINEYFPGFDRYESDMDEANNINLNKLWAIYDVEVSSGTYIRAWAEDLGNILGLGAYAFMLRRSKNGPYELVDSIKLDELEKLVENGYEFWDYRDGNEYLLSIADVRDDWSMLKLKPQEARRIVQGQRINLEDYEIEAQDEELIRIFTDDLFLGIGKILKYNNDYILKAERIFITVEYLNSRFN